MRKQVTFWMVLFSVACSPDIESAAIDESFEEPFSQNNDSDTTLDPNLAADSGLGGPQGTAPDLLFAESRFSGRFGLDLRIHVQGADADANVIALWLQYLDGEAQPILRFDSDGDGVEDLADELVAFDQPIHGLQEFSGAYTVRRFFEAPGAVAKVAVALQDAEGLRSATQILEFAPQPVLGFGDPCDPSYVLDRCEPGMGCRGEPATCLDGLPPNITKFAYLSDFGTPRILVEGVEPDDDMQLLHLEFLTQEDTSVSIDMNGDGSTDSSTYSAGPTINENGEFFLELYPDDSFADVVSRIAVTPIDAFGNEGERVVTDIAPIIERDWNQGCDPRGFDMCTQLATCIPGIPGANNICGAPNRARQDQCEDAVTLYAPDDNLRFFGEARGSSLWDPSEGCVTEFGMGGPEEIVLLELSRGVPSLTLTTDFPNTDFDTVLYVMPGMCPAPGADGMYLGCADDAVGTLRSTLTLTNVPAGDYLVVIDSWDEQGGNFQLSVSTD